FPRNPELEINTMVRGEIDVVGSYSSLREDYVLAATALAEADGFEDVVTTAFPLTEALTALEATASGASSRLCWNRDRVDCPDPPRARRRPRPRPHRCRRRYRA